LDSSRKAKPILIPRAAAIAPFAHAAVMTLR